MNCVVKTQRIALFLMVEPCKKHQFHIFWFETIKSKHTYIIIYIYIWLIFAFDMFIFVCSSRPITS